jgi:hypothetical protein
MKRFFIGTSSLETMPKLNCVEAANPIKTIAPISDGMVFAVHATIQPTKERSWPEMKNQRRLLKVSGRKLDDC